MAGVRCLKMFQSEFFVYRENDDSLEFRRKKSQLYIYLVIGIILFLFPLLISIDTLSSLFTISLGVFFLLIGIVPVLESRKIIIDKTNMKIQINIGMGKFLFRSKTIQFSQVKNIEIKESPLCYRDVDGDEIKDTIYLKLNGENDVKIATSSSDIFSNEFTHKLSQTIGCRVVCVRW